MIHIVNDDINEADQVFVVWIHFDEPDHYDLDVMINVSCNVSLGWIKDNDREWIDQYSNMFECMPIPCVDNNCRQEAFSVEY